MCSHSSHRFIMFNWLQGYLQYRGTFGAFDELTGTEAKSDVALTTIARSHSIQRIALIHTLARSTNVDLRIAWNLLRNCTKITFDFPIN